MEIDHLDITDHMPDLMGLSMRSTLLESALASRLHAYSFC